MSDTIIGGALLWLLDGENWAGPQGVAARLVEHLWLSAVSVLLAAVVALPAALVLGHLGRGGALASTIANIGRAVPTLAVLIILVLSPPPFGSGNEVRVVVVALVLFAVPPILTNAYAGIRAVDQDVVEAARGMGLTGPQVLWRVEVPLALPLVVAGLRIASAQVIGTLTVAALIAGPGLGRIITRGFGNQDTPQFVAGALVVATLAVLVELAFQLLQRRFERRRTSVARVQADPAVAGVPSRR